MYKKLLGLIILVLSISCGGVRNVNRDGGLGDLTGLKESDEKSGLLIAPVEDVVNENGISEESVDSVEVMESLESELIEPLETLNIQTEDYCPPFENSDLYRERSNQLEVGPEQDWEALLVAAEGDTEILLSDGVYKFTRYAVWLATDDITIRGASGNGDAVILEGKGFSQGGEGLMIAGSNITVADLTLKNIRDHAISMKGEISANGTYIYNVNVYDVGGHHVKLTPGGAVNGKIACSRIGDTDEGIMGDYNGGIDLWEANGWVIRDNVIYNIRGDGTGCEIDRACGRYSVDPAILIQKNSRDVVIERNILINNLRHIGLGINGSYSGGILRNNFVYDDRGENPGIEAVNVSNTLFAHNTIYVQGEGVSVSGNSSNVRVFNNLMSGEIIGTGFEAEGNIEDLLLDDFNEAEDVHVIHSDRFVGTCTSLDNVNTDIDGNLRDDYCYVGADFIYGIALPPSSQDFCPPYVESDIYRARTNQIILNPTMNWVAEIETGPEDTEYLLEDGEYYLDRYTVVIEDNKTIRSRSGDRDAVIIRGQGYGVSSEGLMIFGDNVTIADLSMTGMRNHAISIKTEQGVRAPHIYNVDLYDIGTQMVKASYHSNHVADGIVACSSMGYTEGGSEGDYFAGVDAHSAIDWVIRDNYMYNFMGDGSGCEVDISCGTYVPHPAILVWNDSRGTVIKRNILVDNYRNIALGLDRGHDGGQIINNFIYREQPGDAGIELRTASNVLVAHNTVYTEDYFGAIEVSPGNNIRIINNFISNNLRVRDGASFYEEGNLVDLTISDFAASYSYKLVNGSHAIGACDGIPEVITDMDGQSRDVRCDIGADFYIEEDNAPDPDPNPDPDPDPDPDPEPGPDPGPDPEPSDRALITIDDIEPLGAFRLPLVGGGTGPRFGWGGFGLAYKPGADSGSLFTVGHDQYHQIAEFSIPTPKSISNLSSTNVAQVLQPFRDITEGKKNSISGANGSKMGGIAWLDNKLYWTAFRFYNVEGINDLSHGMSNDTLANFNAQGMWRLNGFHSQMTAGYIFTIPDYFADEHLEGKKLVSGFNIMQGISASSAGPAVFAYDPLQYGNGSAPGTGESLDVIPLLYYPFLRGDITDYSLEHMHSDFLDYQMSDWWEGGTWVHTEDKHAVIITGRRAEGPTYYGVGRSGACDYSYGYHGHPYAPSILFYDPDDLAAAAAGTQDPTQIQPYLEWDPSDYMVSSCEWRLTGAAYDDENHLLYIIHYNVDRVSNQYEPMPLVYVFSVN